MYLVVTTFEAFCESNRSAILKLAQSEKLYNTGSYPDNSPLGHFCEHLFTKLVVSPESSAVRKVIH